MEHGTWEIDSPDAIVFVFEMVDVMNRGIGNRWRDLYLRLPSNRLRSSCSFQLRRLRNEAQPLRRNVSATLRAEYMLPTNSQKPKIEYGQKRVKCGHRDGMRDTQSAVALKQLAIELNARRDPLESQSKDDHRRSIGASDMRVINEVLIPDLYRPHSSLTTHHQPRTVVYDCFASQGNTIGAGFRGA